MPPKSIIFDLDETLSDRRTAIEHFLDRLIQSYSYNEMIWDYHALKQCFLRADNNGYRDKQEVYRQIVEELSWNNPPASDEYLRFWKAEFPGCTTPMPGLVRVLEYFQDKGLLLAVITNGGSQVQNGKIDKLHIRHLIDCIIISDEVGIKKPDGRIFQMALDSMKILPAEAWFVGDHPKNDICGAAAMGIPAIWMDRGLPWPEECPSTPFASIDSLKQLIKLYEASLSNPRTPQDGL